MQCLKALLKNYLYQRLTAVSVLLAFLSIIAMVFCCDADTSTQGIPIETLTQSILCRYSSYENLLSFQANLILSQLLLDSSKAKLQEYMQEKEEKEQQLVKIMEAQLTNEETKKNAVTTKVSEQEKLSNDETSSRNTFKKFWNISATERMWLERIVMAEAGGEPYEGQIAVANVVLNRVKAGFGKNIYEVIFQKGQFTPVTNGSIYKVIPSASVKKAVSAALNGVKVVSDDVLYFYNPSIATNFWISETRTFVKKIGNHYFYK